MCVHGFWRRREIQKKMLELREGSCFSKALVGANVGLACVDGVLSVLALIQVWAVLSCYANINSTELEISRRSLWAF